MAKNSTAYAYFSKADALLLRKEYLRIFGTFPSVGHNDTRWWAELNIQDAIRFKLSANLQIEVRESAND